MNLKIFNKIEILLNSATNDKFFPNIEKIEFIDSSIQFSGDYIIIIEHDKTCIENTKCTPFNLSKIKEYRTKTQ